MIETLINEDDAMKRAAAHHSTGHWRSGGTGHPLAACAAYLAMVGISIAAAASLLIDAAPLVVMGV